MQAIRQIYQDTPSVIHISIPEELQHHPVEVIIRVLDDSTNSEIKETDANGWPIGFFWLHPLPRCLPDNAAGCSRGG